jgi:DNA-binding NtrC family response regulator
MATDTSPPDRAFVRGRIIVVDDDRRAASQTAQWLCSLGWRASAVGSAEEARHLLRKGAWDACVIDGLLPKGAAGRLLAEMPLLAPATGMAVILPAAAMAPATDVIPLADAVVESPVRDDALLAAIERACQAGRGRLSAPAGARVVTDQAPVLGTHPAMRHVMELVERIAGTSATVLVTGESGTGKSLLAREIHRVSPRNGQRFVEVACGSLSESLLESELFGHVAGAFTGATADRPGKFQQADGGTIFLDEIATASPAMQVKLLRVLQEFEFEPVGGGSTQAVDARLILATHEDLTKLVAAGRFRADLFWRINVVTIEMPALRQRASDIPLLVDHFLTSATAQAGRNVTGFSSAASEALLAHSWPGNVRELQHAVERAVFIGRGTLVELGDLPPAVVAGAAGRLAPCGAEGSLRSALEQPERQLILDALERNGWRRDAAARALGINRTTLYKKLKRLGMDLTAFAPVR